MCSPCRSSPCRQWPDDHYQSPHSGQRPAASDPRMAARTSDWDAHPMFLNTPAGILDLETGEILRHDPALLLTQMTTA
ncbi:MAG: hypothetical protein CMF72_04795 [Mameliella sp.]|nr:hypothetical protein [Mameliella sp.]